MKTLRFVSLYYWPDDAAVGRLMTHLAEDCAAAGYEVDVLTSRSPNRPMQLGTGAAIELRNGVTIRRLRSTRFGRRRAWGRFLDYATFTFGCLLRLLIDRRDVVIVNSSPFFLPWVGAVARRVRGNLLVYKIEDLFPALLLRLGILRRGLATRFFEAAGNFVLRSTDLVIAIDENMLPHLKPVCRGRLDVIANWADAAELAADGQSIERLRSELKLAGKRVVLYSGNFGYSHCFDGMLAAVERFAHSRSDVHFVFVGDGALEAPIIQAARKLDNLTHLPPQSRERSAAIHALSDVIVVTLRPEADGMVTPSKFYTALAAGKPVLFVGGSGNDVARTILQHDLGAVARNRAEEIMSALDGILDQAAPSAAQRARLVFDAGFSRAAQTRRWLDQIERADRERAARMAAHA